MTVLHSLTEIEAKLAEFVPLSKEITGKNLTLERMRPMMVALGNPHERLKIIHIAGTSGKTSTAYYIAALLTAADYKTGLTVSPHVDSVLERVQVSMQPLSEDEFGAKLGECLDIIEKAKLEPTYFELLVAFAYLYFDREDVDYAVIETGIGGLQDATNIAARADKICVITDIGLDHMHILGRTVPEIARQKAGIIHAHNTAVMFRQSDEIMDVFESHCQQVGARLVIANEQALAGNDSLPGPLAGLPEFQRRNWLLAGEAVKLLQISIKPGAVEASLGVRVPGRMDTVQAGGKTIVMDGAHNEQKARALVSSFQRRYPNVMVPVVLSLKHGKEFTAVLPLLKPITGKLIVTEFAGGQDLPSVAIDARELADAARRLGIENVVAEPDPQRAFELAQLENSKVILVTGSFYLIGQLRQTHVELKHA